MRYANRQNAFDREAAHGAIVNRINANLRNPSPERDNLQENANPLDEINVEERNPEPIDQVPDENEGMLLGEAAERRQDHAPDNANVLHDKVLQQAQAQPIPVPPVAQGRRPYHTLARENAEALNVLLTRELPVLTQQFTVSKKMAACRFYQNALRASSKNSGEKMTRSKS